MVVAEESLCTFRPHCGLISTGYASRTTRRRASCRRLQRSHCARPRLQPGRGAAESGRCCLRAAPAAHQLCRDAQACPACRRVRLLGAWPVALQSPRAPLCHLHLASSHPARGLAAILMPFLVASAQPSQVPGRLTPAALKLFYRPYSLLTHMQLTYEIRGAYEIRGTYEIQCNLPRSKNLAVRSPSLPDVCRACTRVPDALALAPRGPPGRL